MYIHTVFFVYRISEAPQVAVVGHQLPEKLQLIIGEAIPHQPFKMGTSIPISLGHVFWAYAGDKSIYHFILLYILIYVMVYYDILLYIMLYYCKV